jgi:hypothetical protein
VERCGKYTQSIGTISSVVIWIIVPIMIGDIGIHFVGSIRSYVQINVSSCGNSDKLPL